MHELLVGVGFLATLGTALYVKDIRTIFVVLVVTIVLDQIFFH